ncbi:MAG: TrkA family potassium uptake protein [Dehalococcoidia bacterium]|nr:TrkA family potassium uptake protein [Dehalococcoidia bacterium]
MYIILVGGGKVGFHLARALLSEGHEVLVIERDRRKCVSINDELGSVVLQGDGCEAAILAEAGASRADLVIAVTGGDEDNLVVCQLAKGKFHTPRTIARINNPKNESIFKKLGIDDTISSTQVIMERIQAEIPSHPLLHLASLGSYGLELVNLSVAEGAAAAGHKLRDISLPPQTVVSLIIGADGPRVPTGDTLIQIGDEVIAVTRVESEDALRAQFASQH